MLAIIAMLFFVAAAVWSAVNRAWPFVLLAVGLAIWVLSSAPIRIVT